ncbi:hypothetical protein GCM10009634_76410 [Saccharothrix xinjiangensis]
MAAVEVAAVEVAGGSGAARAVVAVGAANPQASKTSHNRCVPGLRTVSSRVAEVGSDGWPPSGGRGVCPCR